MEKFNLAACVVFYNPVSKHVNNIKSYINYIDNLYIIDNSENSNYHLLFELSDFKDKIRYIHVEYNGGIAYGLNLACGIAYKANYKWILTMDQDSFFDSKDLAGFFQNTMLSTGIRDVGIISPQHITQVENSSSLVGRSEFIEVKSCMTSGNLLNLNIWKKVGKFAEPLFIDSVDHEYCLRLRSKNYKVLVSTQFALHHELGDSRNEMFSGFKITSTNHNYIRRYYMTRNRLFCIKLYFSFDPLYILNDIFALFKEIIKIPLIESNKTKKIRSVIRGARDFALGRMGKYNYKD
jgi:rhamnosyltransferase